MGANPTLAIHLPALIVMQYSADNAVMSFLRMKLLQLRVQGNIKMQQTLFVRQKFLVNPNLGTIPRLYHPACTGRR